MQKPRILLNQKEINQRALQDPKVRKAIRDKAERMLPVAQRAALSAGALDVARSMKVEAGMRPGTKSPTGLKRPFARVVADDPQGSEHGNRGVPKIAFLRKSMRA